MSDDRRKLDWIERSHRPLREEEEDELVGDILQAGETRMLTLISLARDRKGRTLCRCAAIDRYVQLEKDRLQCIAMLTSLVDARLVQDEDVRTVAVQWLYTLDSPAEEMASGTRGGQSRENATGWRNLIVSDPSPRIRLLATLEQTP